MLLFTVTGETKAFDRGAVNGFVGLRDGRIFAYRHGSRKSYGRAGDYRLNVVFFDGHGETLDDFTASDPNYWLPKGASGLDPAGAIGTRKMCWPDWIARKGVVGTMTIH